MLRIVIETKVPKEYTKIHHQSLMTLQRIQADPKGKIRAFVIIGSSGNYKRTIIENHECRLAKALLSSGAIVLHAQIKDGEVLWILTCTWDGFRRLLSNLDSLRLKYEIIFKTTFYKESTLTNKA